MVKSILEIQVQDFDSSGFSEKYFDTKTCRGRRVKENKLKRGSEKERRKEGRKEGKQKERKKKERKKERKKESEWKRKKENY